MYVRCNNPERLFRDYSYDGDRCSEVPFDTMVLAILRHRWRRFFRYVQETQYLLIIPVTDFVLWYKSDYFDVIEPTIPNWWTCVKHDKKVWLHPKDKLSGDGSVFYSDFNGPIEIVNEQQLLVDLVNVNRSASDAIRKIYLDREKIDINPED